MADKEVKQWITINGRHIPLFDGESKADAIKRLNNENIQKDNDIKEKQIAQNKAEADKLNGKVESKAKADKTTQRQHKQAIKELSADKYEDGTYDISTKKTKSFDSGYQVTFCQIGDNYSDEEYAGKVNECLAFSSDGKTYAGKFEGTPEISFHCNDRKQAEQYARANNQISIWDWKQNQTALAYSEKYGDDDPRTIEAWIKCEIKTGGTGERGKRK